MPKEFRTTLPQKFVENTIALCGAKGEKWLDALPATIAELEASWSIEVAGHFRNLSYNYVANAIFPDGKSAVLKIGLPLTDVEIYGEAAYLRAANGVGAARLLEFDRDRQAVLLERVDPGSNLKSVCKKDQARAVGIAIKILKRILKPVPVEEYEFIKLDDWFDGL